MSVPANKKCCVSNCGKSRNIAGPEVILHNFPNLDNDMERFRTWLYAVGGNILSLDQKQIHKYKRVCHFHFASGYYTRSNRLSANAVPTKHLPGSDKVVLHRFPNPDKDMELFNAWVDSIGGDVLFLEKNTVYRLYRICHLHFADKYQSGSGRVTKTAIPTLLLSGFYSSMIQHPMQETANTPLPMAHQPATVKPGLPITRDRQSPNAEESQTKESMNDSVIELNDEELVKGDDECTEVEYIDDDVLLDDSCNSPDVTPENDEHLKTHDFIKEYDHLKPEDHLKPDLTAKTKSILQKDIKLTLDDIDHLFLSYAKTFRSLTKQFQTMLKLDLAKLFARYEMKNTGIAPEEAKPLNLHMKPPLAKPVPALKEVQKPSVFVTSKEENKIIYRRVPLQGVISATHKSTIESSPVILSQIKRPPIHIQKKMSEDYKLNTSPQSETVSKLELSAKLGQLKTYVPQKSSDRLQSPPTKVMKYYVPQKNLPATLSKPESQISQSNQIEDDLREPDLQMDVSQSDTET